MAPQRSSKYLAFIRSLPCCVPKCGEIRSIEAHHTGLHGMGQKADDHTAIPLCHWHHQRGPDSVHVLGQREFARVHQLDIPALVQRLNTKPVINVEAGVYVGYLEGREYPLGPQSIGIVKAIRLMRDHRREELAEEWRATS